MLLPPGKGKKPALDLFDLPKYTRETLGLSGVNLSTELLAGADRARLEGIRERADRCGCACLLLVEPDAQNFGGDDKAVLAARERTIKVVQAAQILGCSACAIKVTASDDDAALARVASALKPCVERAERLDINLLIAPAPGLTAKPERVTELLKKVGGFRIGTFPDFESAAASPDPVSYLHRLTPYATAVCATTIKLLDPLPVEPPKPVRKAPAVAPVVTEDVDAKGNGPEDPKRAKAAKKGKSAEPEPAEEEEEEELDEEELDELAALIEGDLDSDDDEEPALVARKHEPYDLRPLVQAIMAVGYDGPLSIEYRGKDDVVTALTQTRDTLVALVQQVRMQG